MRWRTFAFFVLFFLASCKAPAQPQVAAPQCGLFEIPSDGGCCRDLNENDVCDTVDFAEDISAEQQREYDEAAARARAKAEASGTLKRTIMNDVYDNASAVTSYRFVHNGDEVVVANGSIVRKLLLDHPIGDQMVDGRRTKAVVNTITLDFANKKATGQCVPPAALVRQGRSTQCDAYKDLVFEVPFEEFAFKMPIAWLEDFLHRTPYEILPGQHVTKLTATLYRFTDLKDAQRKTSLWIADTTSIPVRVEVWQGNALVQQEDYFDLYRL